MTLTTCATSLLPSNSLSACSTHGSGSACLSERLTFFASGSNFITSTETTSPIFTTSDGCLMRAYESSRVVDEAVDAAEVDERAELREPHDDAFADLADGQRAEQLLLLLVEFFFEHLALREHDAMALVIEVDHLQAQLLADEFVEVADRLAADLRCGDEAAHAEVDEDAALDDLRDRRFDHFVVVVRFDDLFPGLERAGAAFAEEQTCRLGRRSGGSSPRACRRP